MLVTLCWWPILGITSVFYVGDPFLMLVPSSWCWWRDLSPTSKTCHQLIWSPTSVTKMSFKRTKGPSGFFIWGQRGLSDSTWVTDITISPTALSTIRALDRPLSFLMIIQPDLYDGTWTERNSYEFLIWGVIIFWLGCTGLIKDLFDRLPTISPLVQRLWDWIKVTDGLNWKA